MSSVRDPSLPRAAAPPGTATRCAVCAGSSDRVVWREGGYQGRRCRCGTVYVHPEPPADAIDATRLLHPEAFYALPAEFKAGWVAAVTARGRLLEIGCGEGHFLAAARTRGYEVVGLEPHPGRARRASERLGIAVECARLETTRLPRASFDVVYHCDLLSHFPDPVGALRLMRDLLRPKGRMCFEVGILGGISPAWYRLVRQLGYPDHRWLYSETALYALLRRAGFRIESVRRFGQAPRLVVGLGARALVRMALLPAALVPRVGRRADAHPESIRRALASLDNFLRYRAGRLAPGVGPASLFALALRDTDP